MDGLGGTERNRLTVTSGIDPAAPQPVTVRKRLATWAPGLAALSDYRRADLPHDLAGGIAVAAVTVPVSIANAQLAGLPPEHGLYASIVPLVIYALLGTSRHLIVGTSAATAALIASAIGTLGIGDPDQPTPDPIIDELVRAADLIVAKGQGNFETLNEMAANVFFLFQAKCPVVARHIGKPIGTFVLCRSDSLDRVVKTK